MSRSLEAFALSIIIITLLVAVALGLMIGLAHPLPWISLALLIAVVVFAKRLAGKRFLTWDDSYSVGIASLDEDHKRLLNLLNQLQTAAHYQTSDEYVQEAFDALVDYTKYHFQHEEEIMEQHGYPDLEAHRKQHQAMIDEVGKLATAYKADRDSTIEGTITYLQEWLLNHIKGTDKGYSTFLNDKGVH